MRIWVPINTVLHLPVRSSGRTRNVVRQGADH